MTFVALSVKNSNFYISLDIDPVVKQDIRKSDVDDNNRSASDYLSKLLNSRDFSNDLDGSPSTLSNSEANGYSYVPMKSTSSSTPQTRSSSVQRSSASTQKRGNRSSHKHKPAEVTSNHNEFVLR